MFEESGPMDTVSSIAEAQISDARLGKIRYSGGRCVAKANYLLLKSIKSNLYKP